MPTTQNAVQPRCDLVRRNAMSDAQAESAVSAVRCLLMQPTGRLATSVKRSSPAQEPSPGAPPSNV